MDWVKTFYERQHTWINVYSGEVEAWHRDKPESIVLSDRERPYRILELGCGGGKWLCRWPILGMKSLPST